MRECRRGFLPHRRAGRRWPPPQALLAYAGRYPDSKIFGPAITHTNSPRKLAVTFDDGPNPTMTPKLLDLLDRHKARATFFVIGKFARQHPELLRETVARGHVIGNHTESHPNLFWSSASQTRDELRRCQDAITSRSMRHRNSSARLSVGAIHGSPLPRANFN